ncbi:hypothetical protein ACUNV4_30045 [Granulosicoccus sp. 3-233]|uniref:hypothetical protein n=1 Tax=Granulosicoccus sp. 3-233 TaxID=3417969 RepID=UPI003D33DF38
MKNEYGILLSAYGQKYIEESKVLVKSIRKHMPSLDVALVTDGSTEVPEGLYDHVRRVNLEDIIPSIDGVECAEIISKSSIHTPKMKGFFFKIKSMSLSPFSRTLFLDTDTIIGHPVNDVFHLLEKYDVVVGYAPTKTPSSIGLKPINEIEKHAAVPRINTGVVGFSESAVCDGFFSEWEKLLISGLNRGMHISRPKYSDQAEFRRLIWNQKSSLFVLPVEYHLRSGNTAVLEGPVRILHGRPSGGREKLIDFLNSTEENRIWIASEGMLKSSDDYNVTHSYTSYSNSSMLGSIASAGI